MLKRTNILVNLWIQTTWEFTGKQDDHWLIHEFTCNFYPIKWILRFHPLPSEACDFACFALQHHSSSARGWERFQEQELCITFGWKLESCLNKRAYVFFPPPFWPVGRMADLSICRLKSRISTNMLPIPDMDKTVTIHASSFSRSEKSHWCFCNWKLLMFFWVAGPSKWIERTKPWAVL